MRIAVLATNRNPLSRPFAGGQESLTAALVAGFRAQGHHVLLFAADGTPSDLADDLVVYPALPRLSEVAALDHQIPEPDFLADHHAFTFAMGELAARDGEIDVVANHSLHHLPMSLSRLVAAPVVTTLHTPPFPWMELGAALAAPTARYVAVSAALAARWTTLTGVSVVRNGADPSAFVLGRGSGRVPPSGGLVWVGRITPEKAPHLAIAAARRTGRKLRIVGPISDAVYFATRVEPQLDAGGRWTSPDRRRDDGCMDDGCIDEASIEYVGALPPEGVAGVVGSSDALLVTPVWDEPFGLVAVEAALCGTPVVALHRGGVAEAVAPGAGVLVPNGGGVTDAERVAALVAALDEVASLDRASVRESAIESLSLDACVAGHLGVLTRAVHDVSHRYSPAAVVNHPDGGRPAARGCDAERRDTGARATGGRDARRRDLARDEEGH